jgi:glycosyltransferase involved in cell wall biosynthesis
MRIIVAATTAGDVSVAATEALFEHVHGLELRWLPAIGKISNTPVGFGWKRRLRRIIEEENVALVNAHGPVPFVADIALLASSHIPFILTYHSGPMAKGRWWIDVALRAYEEFVLRRTVERSDAVICASEYVRRTLPSAIVWPAEVIHPAVDTDLFCPGGPPRPYRVLFVGSLTAATRYKGLSDLLEAIDLISKQGYPISLEVVGDGDDRSRYEKEAKSRGIAKRVLFSGPLRGERLVQAYWRSVVVAVPSRFDNFPTVAIEAMACARPVVATKVGSVPDLIRDRENGIVVSPGNARSLADGLTEIIEDNNMASRMGDIGRRRAISNLSLAAQAAKTLALYQRVLATHRG